MAYANVSESLGRGTLVAARLDLRQTSMLGIVCVCAAVAPLAARWIPDDVARVAYGSVLAAVFLTFSLFAKRHRSALHQFWQLSFAFFVLALVQVLNNSIPGFVGSSNSWK